MIDRFTLSPFEFFRAACPHAFPFRYGLASYDVPHLFARNDGDGCRKASFGLSAEGLPPKWFTEKIRHDVRAGLS